MRRPSLTWLGLMLGWPSIAGASGSIYVPPESVVVTHERGLLVAQLDQEHQRWVSLCKDGPNGSLEFDVRGLERYGPLFDARLHWEGSGGFMSIDEMYPEWQAFLRGTATDSEPAPPEEGAVDGNATTTVDLQFVSVSSLSFTTAREVPEKSDVEYWGIEIHVSFVGGRLYPLADVEATPVDRDGVPESDAESLRSQVGVTLLRRGQCKLPDLRRIQRRAAESE